MNATPPAALHPMPFTRIEVAVMAVIDGSLQVLLARRSQAPHARKWALPGGALRIDLDGSLEAAADRVMHERLGLEPRGQAYCPRQLRAVGGPSRDPRAPWALSVVYRALVRAEAIEPSAGKRIEALAWRPVSDVVLDRRLAFDHAALVAETVDRTRGEVAALTLPYGLLPASFTLGELQAACEAVLGEPLDKASFRRRLGERNIVEPVAGAMRGGPFRPAQLYRAPASRRD